MSELKHTPPPWNAEGVFIFGPDGLIAEAGFGMRDDSETYANARLLATAPELLDALTLAAKTLRGLEAHLHMDVGDSSVAGKCEVVIAKATA